MGKQLFDNISFWLSKNIPQRSHFKEQIENNGGTVVIRENDADVLLVDHLKRNSTPDTYSYRFVEASIRSGKLQKLEDFRVGQDSGSTRPAGSSTIAPRQGRVPYTAEDDQILWDWMKPIEQKGGGASGHAIYKQLEEKNPRHPWQSWREHYLKYVQPRLRSAIKKQAHNSPSGGRSPLQEQAVPESDSQFGSFTKAERDELLKNAGVILEVDPGQEDQCWENYAEEHDNHSAAEWKNYFHTFVRPRHEKRMRDRRASKTTKSPEAKKGLSVLNPVTAAGNRPLDPTQGPNPNVHITGRATNDTIELDQEANKKRRRTLPDSVSSVKKSKTKEQNRRATEHRLQRVQATSPGVDRDQNIESTRLKRPLSLDNSLHQPPSPQPQENQRPSKRARQASNGPSSPEEDTFGTAPQFPSLNDLLAEPIPYFNDSDHPFDVHPEPVASKQPEINETEKKEIQEVDDWIDSRKSQGFDEHQIIDALRCTSMDTELADTVLGHLKAGKGIPKNMKGVWTKEDDDTLADQNARAIETLGDKHGSEYVNARFEYLNIVSEISIDI